MITNNKLDRSFGPVGASAGVFLFIAGIALSYFYFSGLILVLLGAFVGFTSSSTLVDYEKRRVRFSNNLFGFIQTGKWIQIEPSMKIGIRQSNQTYRAYSRGNRPLDIASKDIRLILFDSGGKEIIPLKKLDSAEAASIELEKECSRLDLKSV
ncbi:MAG: hypothetical protein NT040_01330 [Bacteroidetes bacterium]|nr:hypothetical protein [Bacteroidota bacterium]